MKRFDPMDQKFRTSELIDGLLIGIQAEYQLSIVKSLTPYTEYYNDDGQDR